MQHSILVVDDEKDILDSLERQFRKHCRVLKASSGHEALQVLQKEKVQLILSDQRMPEMTGVQLFDRVQKIQPDAIRILLTGYTDVESVIAAINTGQIYRYITKPWDPADLEIVVTKALETYDLRIDLQEKNIRLEKALKELQTLDQAKSQFMILIGHELKTPLTTISSFLDLLREEKLNADQSKYLQRITQGTDRLKQIVFDVLELLSAETGTMPLHPKKQSLDELVSRIAKDHETQLHQKSLKLCWEPEKISASFDAALIEKVLRRILHNAIKFSPEKSEIKVTVNSEKESLRVAVANKGEPLSEEDIERIMKPFALNENIMNHSQGFGLGLALCQSLLKHHGSQIQFKSQGAFNTVSFDLKKS